MVQRYWCGTEYDGGQMYEADGDHKGDYVEWDDVKDQLEWRDLTEECRPKNGQMMRVWIKNDEFYDVDERHGYLSTKNNIVEFMDVTGKGIYDFKNIFNSDNKTEFKWQLAIVNPWENKQ